MNIRIYLFVFIIACFISSCHDSTLISPLVPTLETVAEKNNSDIRVMTRNIYVGANVDKILLVEDPNEIPLAVAEVFQTLIATNFPERAQALANEVFEFQPHLIGLQEVSLLRIQSPGDAVIGGDIPAEKVFIDYLSVLLQTMEAMGLEYNVVAKVENFDIEMPMVVSAVPEFDDIRLTDYDVILAKKDLKITDVVEENYRAKVILEDLGIEYPRGYVAVTATIDNNYYRFVNTHLEDADQEEELLRIQKLQATELMNSLARVQIPTILVGDFNSAAPDGLTYKKITNTHRFIDTWILNCNQNNILGYTYGHDFDLLNQNQNFWKRIDYVFVRNGRGLHKNRVLEMVTSEVVGDENEDKTVSGMWPSDHGGVATKLKFAKK